MNPRDAIVSQSSGAHPLFCLHRSGLDDWRAGQSPQVGQWLDVHTFKAESGSLLLFPGADHGVGGAAIGIGDLDDPFCYAHAPYALPPGDWKLASELPRTARNALQLGWGLGAYTFDRYRTGKRAPARLVLENPDAEVSAVIDACTRVRDLVNTPTEHMGPDDLEALVRALADTHGGRVDVVRGDALIEANYPAIHAVGRASHRDPRMISLEWGEASAPHLVLVGKGVCFDTGGLNLKASSGMRNMKKDMGGAAHAIALAGLVMERRLPVHLTLLVPAVENAVGPNALRPGEVIATRKGLSVEVDNTDAEGRLILCDALARGVELAPELMIDFATLTGAARIALGPDLPALYSNRDAVAADWLQAGATARDPLWRMPLWQPYMRYLTAGLADLANASNSSMAGSITAALYLQRFVPEAQAWAHLDVYSWNDSDRPGRPAGGEAQGLRAAWAMLSSRFAAAAG